jgi:hypothetical protein
MPSFVKGRLITVTAPFALTGLVVSITLYDELGNIEATGNASEQGANANYYYSFTPNADGDWRLVMYNGAEKHIFHFPVYSSLKTAATYTFIDTTERQIFEVGKFGNYALTVMFDLDTLETAVEGGIITIKVYNRVDNATYPDKPSARIDHVIGSSLVYPSIEAMRLGGYSKVTIQPSTATTRVIPYYYIVEDLLVATS